MKMPRAVSRLSGMIGPGLLQGIPVLLALLCLPALLPGAVHKLTVKAPIHPITSEYVVDGIARAEEAGAALVLIVMDTPGGLDSSMREIISAIVNARVPVVVYVAPSGARAASAGFFIGVASDIFAMAPGTSTGAAHPVGVSITGQAMDETMAEKVTHDAASYIKTLAERRGRNVEMAEAAVRKSLSYTEEEARKGGLVELVAPTVAALLEELDGRRVRRFDDAETVLDLEGEAVVDVPMTARQNFLLTISNPNLAYILLMIGLLGLYFEFSNPGAVLPGVLGGISLLLAVFAFQILPLNYVGLLFILLAIGLFVLEVKIVSYGILSVGGVIAMIIGSLMLIDAPIPELRPALGVVIPVAVGVSLVCILLVYLVVRAHARRAVTGSEGLVGETGVALTALAPTGKVFVHGEIWTAESDVPAAEGDRVRVVQVLEHLKIRVTRADGRRA